MTLAILGFVLIALAAGSEKAPPTVHDVTVCELLVQPEKYNGKMVRVRGRIPISFETFTLDSSECGQRDDWFDSTVWLEYGRGPKEQPTRWCCGNISPRDKLRMKLDENFKLFHRYLTTTIKDSEGYSCNKYEITATLVGRFDYSPRVTPDDIGGGYGHFGFVRSRIVIQQVFDVSAEDVSQKCP